MINIPYEVQLQMTIDDWLEYLNKVTEELSDCSDVDQNCWKLREEFDAVRLTIESMWWTR